MKLGLGGERATNQALFVISIKYDFAPLLLAAALLPPRGYPEFNPFPYNFLPMHREKLGRQHARTPSLPPLLPRLSDFIELLPINPILITIRLQLQIERKFLHFVHMYRLDEKVWKSNCNYFRRIYIGSNSNGRNRNREKISSFHIYISIGWKSNCNYYFVEFILEGRNSNGRNRFGRKFWKVV